MIHHIHHELSVEDAVVLHDLLRRLLTSAPPISEREMVEVGRLRGFLTRAGRLPARQP